jgi:hypothetical protein
VLKLDNGLFRRGSLKNEAQGGEISVLNQLSVFVYNRVQHPGSARARSFGQIVKISVDARIERDASNIPAIDFIRSH